MMSRSWERKHGQSSLNRLLHIFTSSMDWNVDLRFADKFLSSRRFSDKVCFTLIHGIRDVGLHLGFSLSPGLLTSCLPIPKRLDENKCKCLIFLALPRELNPCFSLERAASSPLDEDPDKHLIEMPSRMRLGPGSSKVSCDRRSEVSHPAAHRLIGHHDAALSQQVLDIPEAEGKPGIEPAE